MPVKLRVHIAPIGFEVERITSPLKTMKADRVYLISQFRDEKATKFIAEIKNKIGVECPGLEVLEDKTDLWDLFSCMKKFREIMNEEKHAGNMIFVNVSTGSKVAAIAGTIACMIWDGTPYYQKVEYRNEIPGSTEKAIDNDYFEVPTFLIKHPKAEHLIILEMLVGSNGKLSKKELIKRLVEKRIIKKKISEYEEFTEAAKHSQLRAFLEPMEYDFHYVHIESRGRKSIVCITQEGKDALKIFGPKQLPED
jgi:CRISPR locus-related DNA-binding protein